LDAEIRKIRMPRLFADHVAYFVWGIFPHTTVCK